MRTGSLVNTLMASTGTPKVGDGATVLMWTDREPATVIAVSPSGKTVTVQMDRYRRTDANGMSEVQSYAYERNPAGEVLTFRLGKRGWRGRGGGVAFGHREKYHDYSF